MNVFLGNVIRDASAYTEPLKRKILTVMKQLPLRRKKSK